MFVAFTLHDISVSSRTSVPASMRTHNGQYKNGNWCTDLQYMWIGVRTNYYVISDITQVISVFTQVL